MPPRTTTSVDTDVVAQLRLAVMRLARRLRQHTDTGATPSQLSALATIEKAGPLSLRALAGLEAIGPSSLTRIVAGLEDAELVERTVDPTDRRVSLVRATAKGRRLLRAARSHSGLYLAQRMAQLDDDDVAALTQALPALQRLLDDDS